MEIGPHWQVRCMIVCRLNRKNAIALSCGSGNADCLHNVSRLFNASLHPHKYMTSSLLTYEYRLDACYTDCVKDLLIYLKIIMNLQGRLYSI